MTTIHHSPPPGATPFAIYEDPETQEPPSPSEEGDVSFMSEMSGADVAIPSIEDEHDLQDEPEPYNGSYTSRTSILSSTRRDSTMTENSFVSSLPSEISVASKNVPPANALESRYSPRKERPPFRNPSSVRAMQMASPTPSLALEAPRERTKGTYKLATPSKSGRSDSVSTTGTRRSRSHRDSLHREYQAQQVRPSATPQPLPLVLLHVTILPMQMPYTPEVMVKIMPEWLVENYKVLEEKLQDIVLMRRGLLIQHPRDEYDVLEERILESLELKTPRLLKCGHFVAPDSDDEETHEHDDEHGNIADDGAGRGSRMSGGTITAEEEIEFRYPTPTSDDAGVCMDCHRQVKKPGHGVGAGTKRWDIKIYAANGLMRAGAWIAAWSEMERCDVEISPWIPHEVRKTLDKRLEQEQEAARVKALYAAELQRQMEEEAALQKRLEEEAEAKRRAEEAELQVKIEAEAVILQKKLDEEAAEKRKLEATLTEKIEEAKEAIRLEFEAQALMEANGVAERFRAMESALKAEREKAGSHASPVHRARRFSSRSRSPSRHRARSRSGRPRVEEIPLGTLLKNYLVLQLQDSRNFFILILGALVVFMLTNPNTNWNPPQPTLDVAAGTPLADVAEPMIPIVVTSTATMTATSFSTLVVTELLTQVIAQETPLPASSDTTALEVGDSSTQISEREPSAVTVPPAETNVDEESADFTSMVSIGPAELFTNEGEDTLVEEETTERIISEHDSMDALDGSVFTETASEEVASSEGPLSTAETTSEKPPVPTESVSPPTTARVPIAEEAIAEEVIAEEFIAEITITEEPQTEPSATVEDDAPPDFATPIAMHPSSEEHAEGETQDEELQETENVLQVEDAPVPPEDDSPPTHGRDEL